MPSWTWTPKCWPAPCPTIPAFASLLAGYFPPAAVAAFPEEPERHRLKREIVTTVLINAIVNLAGPVFVLRTREVTGLSGAEVARGFVLSDGAFGLSALKVRIDALDRKVDAGVQTRTLCRHRRPVPPRRPLVPEPMCRRTRRSPTPWRNIAPGWKRCAKIMP